MTLYPTIWAMKHAPVADAYERVILCYLADRADSDGCNVFPSAATIADYAMLDPKTVTGRIKRLRERGVIRYQQGPPPPAWYKIRRDRRPAIYELAIPYSWWSPDQRAEIDRRRAERAEWGDEVNSLPLSADNRPQLARIDAPTGRRTRSDKGRANPKRSPKNTASTAPAPEGPTPRGESDTPRTETAPTTDGGNEIPGTGGIAKPERGVSHTPEPPKEDPPPPTPPPSAPLRGPGRTDDDSAPPPRAAAARALLNAALHALPADAAPLRTANDRDRITAQLTARLAEGIPEARLRAALCGNLDTARTAWTLMHRAQNPDQFCRAGPARQRRTAVADWCGQCSDPVRRQVDSGPDLVARCHRCHPMRSSLAPF